MRKPPLNLEAEMALCGCVTMMTGKHASGIFGTVRPEHFMHAGIRRIFEACKRCYDAGCEDLDAVIIRDHLQGAPSGIYDLLQDCNEAVPTCSNWRHYAGIVIEDWQRREVIERAATVANMAFDKPLAEVLGAIDGITKRLDIAGDPGTAIEDVTLDDDKDLRGVPTGIRFVDNLMTTRGYPSSQVSYIVAGTKAGKTSLMIQSALANPDKRIAYATFEMPMQALKRRMLKQLTGYYRTPSTLEEAKTYDNAMNDLDMRDMVFYDPTKRVSRSSRGMFAGDFVTWCIDKHARRPWDLILVDYAQLMRVNSKQNLTELQILEEVSAEMVYLAKKLACPVVVGSQARQGEDGQLRTKGAGRFEEDAGLVLLIERKLEQMDGTMTIKLNRFGKSGQSTRIRWDDTHLTYREAL